MHCFIHSLLHSFIHKYLFIHLIIHSLTCSLIHSFTHSFFHSLVLSLIHSFTHFRSVFLVYPSFTLDEEKYILESYIVHSGLNKRNSTVLGIQYNNVSLYNKKLSL